MGINGSVWSVRAGQAGAPKFVFHEARRMRPPHPPRTALNKFLKDIVIIALDEVFDVPTAGDDCHCLPIE